MLFADLVGSMDIAAAVGAERLREIMAGLVGRAAAVVHRYGGTMDRFTGDGLMAVFGAPIALEDHAIRACLAGLGMQCETQRLAEEVQRRDGVKLQLRVGPNSGQVVAGEIGSGVPGYTAIGEQAGLAQRMESVAPPGGVMISESTAHLVENAAVLADPELVLIKGHDEPFPARLLLAVEPGHGAAAGTESTLVGRRGEMAALEAMVEQAIGGRGGWWVWQGRRASARPGWPVKLAALGTIAGSGGMAAIASPTPETFRSMWSRTFFARASA